MKSSPKPFLKNPELNKKADPSFIKLSERDPKITIGFLDLLTNSMFE